jgi:hypothetical protein
MRNTQIFSGAVEQVLLISNVACGTCRTISRLLYLQQKENVINDFIFLPISLGVQNSNASTANTRSKEQQREREIESFRSRARRGLVLRGNLTDL